MAQFRLTPLDLPLVLFLLSAVFGMWPAYDRSLCRNTLIALAAGFLLFMLISRLAVSRGWWRAIAVLIVLAGVLLSLYFVTQYDRFGYTEKVGAIGRLGTFISKFVPPAAVWTPMTNSIATFLEGVVFLAAALALAEKRWVWRIGGFVGVGLIALALLMSASRGAWLAVVVVSVLWLALYWRPARVIAVAGTVLALGLVITVIVQHDITVLGEIPIVNRTLAPLFIRPDRLDVYRNSIYLLQDFPLTGIGLGGQFPMVLSKYALLIQVPFLSYSHNLYLEVWLEHGLLGIVAWLWLMVALYQAARTYARRGNRQGRPCPDARTYATRDGHEDRPAPDFLYQGTWIGLTAVFVHGISDARQYVDLWCWFPFFGLLGLNAAIILRRASAILPATPRPVERAFQPAIWRRWAFPVGIVSVFLIAVLLSLLPLSATVHANLGSVLQARGDLLASLDETQKSTLRQQAVDRYRRAIQIAAYNRTAQQRLGVILMDENRFDEAVVHLEMAQQADPNNTTTHKALGLAYVWVGELEKARPLLQNAPNIVEELNVWGWWRGTQQQTEQSINAYRMSLLLEPDQPALKDMLDQLEGE